MRRELSTHLAGGVDHSDRWCGVTESGAKDEEEEKQCD